MLSSDGAVIVEILRFWELLFISLYSGINQILFEEPNVVIFSLLFAVLCYFQEIRTLCSELLKLKKASAEEMRRSVYANYSAFIR